MSNKVILDTKSANSNPTNVGLGSRIVLDRTAYLTGTDCFSGEVEYLVISANNSKIAWMNNTTASYDIIEIEQLDGGLSKYKIDTLDAIKTTTLGSFIKPNIYIGTSGLSSVECVLEEPLFYWTRNDSQKQRYEWQGQNWSLLKGGCPVNLGVILNSFQVSLPKGVLDQADTYTSIIRVGLNPSQAIILNTKKVAQKDGFSFTTEDAVIYLKENALEINPSFIVNNKGKSVWFYIEELGKSDGIVNPIESEYWLAPLPQGFESPLIRVGFQSYLDVVFVDLDSSLPSSPIAHTVYVSRQSGKMVLDDLNDYGIQSKVFFDGVVLSSKPISFLTPLSIQPTYKIPFRDGLSVGVDKVLDGSGREINGDPTSSRPYESGLVTALLSDNNFVVSSLGGRYAVKVYDVDADIPENDKRKWGRGYLSLQNNSGFSINFKSSFLSHIAKNSASLKFVQTLISLKSYSEDRIYSILSEKYTFLAGTFNYAVDGVSKTITFANDVFNASVDDIVTLFNDPSVFAENGHLCIKGSNEVEILASSDLHILQAFGFVPQIVSSTSTWSISTGLVFDLGVSSDNSKYDYNECKLLNEQKIVDSLAPSTYAFLSDIPREDYKGYEFNKFFKVGTNLLNSTTDLTYLFADKKIGWVEQTTITKRILKQENILELEGGVLSGTTNPLTITKGTTLPQVLVEGQDFDVDTLSGTARYFKHYGENTNTGYDASILGDVVTFTENVTINKNDWVKIGEEYFKALDDIESQSVTLSATPKDQSTTLWSSYQGYTEPLEMDNTLLVGECFTTLDNSRNYLKVRKVFLGNNLVSLYSKTRSAVVYGRFSDLSETPIIVLNPESLGNINTSIVDVTNPRNVSLNFRVSVGNSGYLTPQSTTPNLGVYLDVSTGKLTFNGYTDDSLEVIYYPIPYVPVGVVGDLIEIAPKSPTTIAYTREPVGLIEIVPPSDYVLEPTSGSISFLNSLDSGILIEVDYYKSATENVIETLLFTLSRDVGVKITESEYSFNSLGFDIEQAVNPIVYVGAEIIGYRDGVSAEIDYANNVIKLPNANTDDYAVNITYSIKQTLGGERFVKTANPIWLPLIQVPKDSDTLVLYGDNTDKVSSNSIVKIGTHLFVVDSAVYDGEKTTIVFDKPARFGVGARREGDDPQCYVLSNSNIFMPLTSILGVNSLVLDFKPKSQDIVVLADLRDAVYENSLVFLDDVCYQVKNVKFDNNTFKTTLTFTCALDNHSSISNIMVSIRPLYDQGSKKFYNKGSVLRDKPFVLIAYENGVGKNLIKDLDYGIDFETGEINLKGSFSIISTIEYYLLHTRGLNLKPNYDSDLGVLVYPSYKATFTKLVECPYAEKQLYMKAVVNSRDQFTIRIVDQDDYYAEIKDSFAKSSGTSGSGIGVLEKGVGTGKYNNLAKDVIARGNISKYNKIVTLLENLDQNRIVGDQDGKFKFEIIQATTDIFPSGVEDPITREILPRYVGLESINALSPSAYLIPADPLANLDTDQINQVLEDQKKLIDNQLDDLVFVSTRAETDWKITLSFPFYETTSVYYPVFEPLYKPNVLSRIYPERTESAYFLMGGKKFTFLKTNGKNIGAVSNPVIQPIKNIDKARIAPRVARFRVVGYSKTGYNSVTGSTNPTLILSVVPLNEFPIIDGTNTPDTTKFYSNGDPSASVPDLSTGNRSAIFPPLTKSMKLAHGKYGVGFSNIFDLSQIASVDGIAPQPRKAKIKDIKFGCYVIFEDGAVLESFDGEFLPQRGDTITTSISGDIDDTEPVLPAYRIGFDVDLNKSTGQLYDNSYPSWDDPNFPIKELTSQTPPKPNECLGGEVTFTNTLTEPFNFPALQGLPLNDSGLESIPFFKGSGEELSLLNQMQRDITAILNKQTTSKFVYADEYRGIATYNAEGYYVSNTNVPQNENNAIPTSDLDLVVIKDKGFYSLSKIVSPNKIYFPRFYSIIPQGNVINYALSNAVASDSGLYYTKNVVGLINQYSFVFTAYPYMDLFIPTITNFTLKIYNGVTWTNYLIYKSGATWYLYNGVTTFTLSNVSTPFNDTLYFEVVGFNSVLPQNTNFDFSIDIENHPSTTASIPDLNTFSDEFNFGLSCGLGKAVGNLTLTSDLVIGNCEINIYNLDTSVDSKQSCAINSNATINSGNPLPTIYDANPFQITIPSPNTTNPFDFTIFYGSSVNETTTILSQSNAYVGGINFNNIIHGLSDVSQVLPNDLVKIYDGYASGIYLIDKVIPSNTPTIAIYPDFPTIETITDQGGGIVRITLSKSIDSTWYDNTKILLVIKDPPTNPLVADEIYYATPTFIDGQTIDCTNIKDLFDDAPKTYPFVTDPIYLSGQIKFLPKAEQNYKFTATDLTNNSVNYPITITYTAQNEIGSIVLNPATAVPLIKSSSTTISATATKGIVLSQNFPNTKIGSITLSDNLSSQPIQPLSTWVASADNLTSKATIEVVRVRRFLDVFSSLALSSGIYKFTEGSDISSLTIAGKYYNLQTTNDMTRLVQVGDRIRFYDVSGNETLYLRVSSVVSQSEFICAIITFTSSNSATSYKVYHMDFPPLEQVLEQLFDEITSKKVYTTANVTIENEITLTNPNLLLTDYDYVIIDPTLTGDPPSGDLGRVGQTGYVADNPLPNDDNRGVYKITGTNSVTPVIPLVNLLPSVNGDDENHPLLVTANLLNVILVKKNASYNLDLIEQVLFLRERNLSWVSKLDKGITNSIKVSTWVEYIALQLYKYVGEDDYTSPNNSDIQGLLGNTNLKPDYLNTKDCLSILDRRVFLGDIVNLLNEGFANLNTSIAKPEVLSNVVEDLIDSNGYRNLRYEWIDIRHNRVTGLKT
jgi:hypothetical protein